MNASNPINVSGPSNQGEGPTSNWQQYGDAATGYLNSAGGFIRDILIGVGTFKAGQQQQNQQQQGQQQQQFQQAAAGMDMSTIFMIILIVVVIIALIYFAMRGGAKTAA